MDKIGELKNITEKLRDTINSSICYKQNVWDKKDDGNWNKLWSAFDNIQDTQTAINEYLVDGKFSKLATYGVLQALVVQQDALKHLEEAIGIPPLDFNKHPKLLDIRRVRVESIGHPTKTTKKRDKSLYEDGTITYTSIDPRSSHILEYTVWSNAGPNRKSINILEAVLEQQTELIKEINRVIIKIKLEERKHVKKFKNKSLAKKLAQTGYLIGVLYPYEKNRYHSKFSFDTLMKIYKDFKKDIEERYNVKDLTKQGIQIPGIILEVQKLEKILPKIEKMISMEGEVDETDLEVYVESLDKSFSTIREMAEEIDREFKSK